MSQFFDGLNLTRLTFQPHEGILYAEKTQPNEDAILKDNAAKRQIEQRKMDWGRQVASIPQVLYAKWLKENPELRDPDKRTRDRKLLQLIRENPQTLVVDASKL